MSGPYTQEQYERAKKAVSSGGIPADKVQQVQQRITQYEDDRARGYLPAPAAKEPTSESLSHTPTKPLDMGTSSVTDYLSSVADAPITDPKRQAMVDQVRLATMDDKLPNASKIKALAAPTEWKPKQVANPFSNLPVADKDTQYFYEPPLDQFKEVVASGALSKQLEKEFPGHQGEIPDEWLKTSKTFQAYQDAAWKHFLAESMRNNVPAVRVEYSPMGKIEGAQAKALDPSVAGATGVLSGLSMGLADPVIRAVAPDEAENERRSRQRNPNAAFAGEIVGSLTPWGLPSLAAKAGTAVLSKVGLGSKGLQGLAKSAAAGAATGAVDANVRAIAQAAADAIDAGDTAAEAAGKIYDTLTSQQGLDRTAQGAGMGLAMGTAGHLVGTAADKGARKLVSEEGNLKQPLANSLDAGVKMSPLGEPVLPPELNTQIARARGQGLKADELLAQEAAQPMAAKRLTEMEAAKARGTQETQRMREHFGEATVPTYSAAQDILNLTSEIPGVTGLGKGKIKELNRIARRLRQLEKVSPKQLDEIIDEVDARAAAKEGGPKDTHFMSASAILRNLRDEFASADATTPVGIRDAEGNVKGVSGYGAMKAKQSREQWLQQVDNEHMGLPKELRAQPVDLPKAPDDESLQALAEGSAPVPKLAGRQLAGFESNIQNFGTNRSRDKLLEALGERSGQSGKLQMIKKLRSSQQWKEMLGKAISGIGSSGGTYLKSSQLLRAVPSLKSLSGGLEAPGSAPSFEPTPEAEKLIDRFLAQAVPEAKVANLRGGQAARPGGSINHRGEEKKVRDDMTEEEAQFALQVIKSILATEGRNLQKAQ